MQGRGSQYLLDRRLGGPQSWSRHTTKRKIEKRKAKGREGRREGITAGS
jgi:hypothetical protein